MLKAELKDFFKGIATVTVTYAGSGDSGSIDEVTAHDAKGKEVTLTPEQNTAVEERLYDLLSDLPDWCNNDGGQGTATFTVADDEVNFDHETNWTDNDSQTKTLGRARLSKPLLAVLAALPETVTSILFEDSEEDTGNAPQLVCLDADGRRLDTAPEALEAQLRALAEKVAREGRAGSDNVTYQVDVDRVKCQAEVTVGWTTTKVESEGAIREFSTDSEGPNE